MESIKQRLEEILIRNGYHFTVGCIKQENKYQYFFWKDDRPIVYGCSFDSDKSDEYASVGLLQVENNELHFACCTGWLKKHLTEDAFQSCIAIVNEDVKNGLEREVYDEKMRSVFRLGNHTTDIEAYFRKWGYQTVTDFYVVNNILQKAADDICRYRDELANRGMWAKADAVRMILVDMIHECGDFSCLRRYDNPVQELLEFTEREVGYSHFDSDIPKVLQFAEQMADKAHAPKEKSPEEKYCAKLLTGVICYVLENPDYKCKNAKSVSCLLDELACASDTQEVRSLLAWCNDKEQRYHRVIQCLTGTKDVLDYQSFAGEDRKRIINALRDVFDKEFGLESEPCTKQEG